MNFFVLEEIKTLAATAASKQAAAFIIRGCQIINDRTSRTYFIILLHAWAVDMK